MNRLDVALQLACPTVMCPRYEPLALLEEDGHRFLVAGDGLYLELRRPWLHAILKVSASPIRLPYGQPPSLFAIQIHRRSLIDGLAHFVERARVTSPLEHAAWLTFAPMSSALDYVEPEVISRSGGHIQYHRPDANPDCLPAVDCHSHGTLPAFFSSTDERDDAADDAKIAFVVGNLDRPDVTVAMRFVALGLSVDLSDWVRELLYPCITTPLADPCRESHDY